MSRQHRGAASAAGYPNYSFLTDPIIGKSLVARFKAKGITSRIASSGGKYIPDEIKTTGNVIKLRRMPEAEIFDYQKNQALTYSDLNTDEFEISINRMKYWALKLNSLDLKQVPMIQQFINGWKESVSDKLDYSTSREILEQMPWKVSAFNKGPCAGKRSGRYDLGTVGAPVNLTAPTLGVKLAEIRAVLSEQDVHGDYVVVCPYALQPMMYAPDSLLYDAGKAGMSKSIVLQNGQVFPDLVGFEFIFTNACPSYIDPTTGQRCYTLLVARKDAIIYVNQVTENKVQEYELDTRWIGVNVGGFDMLLPEACAVLYCTL
jgi:hypothetical protein